MLISELADEESDVENEPKSRKSSISRQRGMLDHFKPYIKARMKAGWTPKRIHTTMVKKIFNFNIFNFTFFSCRIRLSKGLWLTNKLTTSFSAQKKKCALIKLKSNQSQRQRKTWRTSQHAGKFTYTKFEDYDISWKYCALSISYSLTCKK
jgi:hypothetical protein